MWIKEDGMRLAVLIDAENIPAKYANKLFMKIARAGRVTVRRVYGDWSENQVSPWRAVIEEYALSARQEYGFAKGKNASDSAMIIDAMDLLYGGNVDGFCIVSSDSDFTALARRLQESGKLVLGAGETKTPRSFVNSCNDFIYLDMPTRGHPATDGQTAKKTAARTSAPEKTAPADKTQIKEDIIRFLETVDGKALLSTVSDHLHELYRDFDFHKYGHATFTKFIETFDEFEIEKGGRSRTTSYIRIKNDAARK